MLKSPWISKVEFLSLRIIAFKAVSMPTLNTIRRGQCTGGTRTKDQREILIKQCPQLIGRPFVARDRIYKPITRLLTGEVREGLAWITTSNTEVIPYSITVSSILWYVVRFIQLDVGFFNKHRPALAGICPCKQQCILPVTRDKLVNSHPTLSPIVIIKPDTISAITVVNNHVAWIDRWDCSINWADRCIRNGAHCCNKITIAYASLVRILSTGSVKVERKIKPCIKCRSSRAIYAKKPFWNQLVQALGRTPRIQVSKFDPRSPTIIVFIPTSVELIGWITIRNVVQYCRNIITDDHLLVVGN